MELFSGFLILVLFIFPLLILYYKYAYAPYQVLKRCGIKGPPPTPFFGHYLQIKKKGVLQFEKDLFKAYGPVFGYYIGLLPTFVVADPEMIKQVTVKEFENFRNKYPRRPKCVEGCAPNGLLTALDQKWKDNRKMLTPTFSTAKMKLMVPLIENSAKTLVEIVGRNLDTGKSFNFLGMYGSFTMETILATAFGRVIDIQRGEANSLTKAATDMFKGLGNLNLLFDSISTFPWIDPVLAYFMKPNPAFIHLYNSALSFVKIRREEGGGKYKDLLQLMMDATGDEEETSCPMETNKKRLTDEDIANNSITFLLAGYETTANTLTFTSYLLALNPHIQEKLQEEIDNYYEENPKANLYEASSDIKYLDMVIQESLRIYPVASRTRRRCNKSTTINGVMFPEGSLTILSVHLLHHDTRFWEDPDKFDPLRFTPEEKAKRPQFCHMPFGSGPRNCIGMRFALLEAKIALIELLKRYTFLRAPDTEVPLKTDFGITLSPSNGVYLRVTSRN